MMNEEERARQSIADVAVENYNLLVRAQETNKAMASLSVEAETEVHQLTETLASLQLYSDNVIQAGERWRQEKQMLRSTMEQQQVLLGLMEAPSLVEECVRNEMYHEALQVAQHVRNWALSAHRVDMITQLEKRVRAALLHSVTENVLPQLCGPMSIDGAFKVVTFCLRLGFSKEEMRNLFLAEKSRFLSKQWAEAAAHSVAYTRVLKCVSVYKAHVSETILQYRVCFSDDAKSTTAPVEGGDDEDLRIWCLEQANHFVSIMKTAILQITNGSELALVLEQCASCSGTASRVGMDVSAGLNELIHARAKSLFAENMRYAVNGYKTSMMSCSWRCAAPASPLEAAAAAATDVSTPVTDSTALTTPPTSLMKWLPLAYALNGLLAAFNAVRKCMVAGMSLYCCEEVVKLHQHILHDLLSDCEMVPSMDSKERDAYTQFAKAFTGVFCPYVLRCLNALLPHNMSQWVEQQLAGDMKKLMPFVAPPVPEATTVVAPPAPAPAPSVPSAAAAPPAPVPAPVPAAPAPQLPARPAPPTVTQQPPATAAAFATGGGGYGGVPASVPASASASASVSASPAAAAPPPPQTYAKVSAAAPAVSNPFA